MNLYKDFFIVILPGVIAGLLANALRNSPALLLAQLDWAVEFSRVVHALTEPGVMATIVASVGALARYEIWKRRLRNRHEREIEDLQRENLHLRRRLKMKLIKVKSSNINAVGFATGKLIVEFKGGARYEGEATQKEYDDFLKAESLGSYFARVFRARMTKIEDED